MEIENENNSNGPHQEENKSEKTNPTTEEIGGRGGMKEYEENLEEHLNEIREKCRKESQNLRALEVYFRNNQKVMDSLSLNIHQSLNILKKYVLSGTEGDSVVLTIKSINDQMDTFSSELKEMKSSMQFELIEPLQLFTQHFDETNENFCSEFSHIIFTISECKKNTEQSKTNYYKLAQLVEGLEIGLSRSLTNPHNKDALKIEEMTNELQGLRFRTEIGLKEYDNMTKETNQVIKIHRERLIPILSSLQQNEESRINFVKSLLLKYMRTNTIVGNMFVDKTEIMSNLGVNINSDSDIQTFISEATYKVHTPVKSTALIKNSEPIRDTFTPVEFLPYKPKNQNVLIFSSSGDQSIKVPMEAQRDESGSLVIEMKEGLFFKNRQKIPPSPQSNDEFSVESITPEHFRAEDEEMKSPNKLDMAFEISYKDEELEEEEFIMVDESNPLKADEMLLNSSFVSLFDNKTLTLEEKAKIIEILHLPIGRNIMSDMLSNITQHVQLYNYDSFRIFGELVNYLLTSIVLEKDYNEFVILSVLYSARYLYTKVENKRAYLTSIINGHGIWQEATMWKKLINFLIQDKLKQFEKHFSNVKKRRANMKKEKKKKDKDKIKTRRMFGGLLSAAKKYLGSMRDTPQEIEDFERGKKTAVYTVLDNFIFHFTNYNVRCHKAAAILLYFSNEYKLDSQRILQLITELESNQSNEKYRLNQKEDDESSLRKREKEMTIFGGSSKFPGLIMGVALGIKFLGTSRELVAILLVSKKWKLQFSAIVWKCALLYVLQPLKWEHRLTLWNTLLNTILVEYELLKKKISYNTQYIENVDEVILMDVQRSFNSIPLIQPQTLISILRTYAFYNPCVEYCQGMNFIVGYLFLVFRDEETVFKVLVCLIDKFDMEDLFKQDVPLLRLYFYQLDRLISIFLPDLHSYLKAENINSSYFSSSWFITLFTNALQYNTDETIPPIILKIWDNFLIHGWKAIFKTAIFILSYYEEKIMSLRFENLMIFLNDLSKSDFFQDETIIKQYVKETKKMKISDNLLDNLGKEYEKIIKIQTEVSDQHPPPKMKRSNKHKRKISDSNILDV